MSSASHSVHRLTFAGSPSAHVCEQREEEQGRVQEFLDGEIDDNPSLGFATFLALFVRSLGPRLC